MSLHLVTRTASGEFNPVTEYISNDDGDLPLYQLYTQKHDIRCLSYFGYFKKTCYKNVSSSNKDRANEAIIEEKQRQEQRIH